MKELLSPQEIKKRYRISASQQAFVLESRQNIASILCGSDPRKLLIVGPCSIHDISTAREYAEKLASLQKEVEEEFLLIMRCYFEKARTALGWPGLLYDPHLDGSHDFEKGVADSRSFLLELADLKMAAGTEFVGKPSALYLSDLISWGSIGARTSSSQTHRHMASWLPMPIGFKNSIDGSLEPALYGLAVAKVPHPLFWVNEEGKTTLIRTPGNPFTHLVLRGGDLAPNYEKNSIAEALVKIDSLLVDCSHGNSARNPEKQVAVFENVIQQIADGENRIRGLMLESFLEKGSQPLQFPLAKGLSITDPCLDFDSTKKAVLKAAKELHRKAKAVSR